MCTCVCVFYGTYKEATGTEHQHIQTSFEIYLHKPKYKYNYTYINLKIKCSIPPHINRCVRIPKYVSGLLISLWEPANSLFVRD